MFTTKYCCGGKKGVPKPKVKETSENVGNFYLRRASVNRSDEERYRNRRGDYGKKASPERGILPVPITGSIEF